MNWSTHFPALLAGAGWTMVIAVASIVFGGLIAFTIGIMRSEGGAVLRTIALVYTEIFRGTSLLVQLFWFYYALPLIGPSFSPMTTGIMCLSMHSGAYGAEIVRAGLKSVSQQQHEAARALNFGRVHTLLHITLPQAIVEMMPAFCNLAVETLKLTSMVSFISIAELTFRAQTIRNLSHDSTAIYTLTLLGYFAMALMLVAVMNYLTHLARRGAAFPRGAH